MNEPQHSNSMDAATVIVAALVASAVGALFYNVLPLFLGSAQDYRGLDNRAIGFLSAAFFVGYNVMTIGAFFWIRRLRWGVVVAASMPVAALSLYASTHMESYVLLLLLTAVAGGAFAAIYAIGTTILGDTTNPARWYGIKIAAEALTGAILLLVLPTTAIARWGFEGAAIGIIVAMVFLSPFLFWMPAKGSKAAHEDVLPIDVPEPAGRGNSLQSPCIWAAIVATLIFFSAASALWAFLERIGIHAGHDPAALGVLLSVTLVAALIGSITAAIIGEKFGVTKPFIAGTAGYLLALMLLNQAGDFGLYALGACGATFAIGFLLPLAITEVAKLDVDGRYVVLSVPAIGLGAMIGPAVGGVLTVSGNYTSLILLCAVAAVAAATLIAIGAAATRPGTDKPARD